MNNEEQYRCIICGERKKVLISVDAELDEHDMFLRHRGICQKCLVSKDIEKFSNDFIMRKIDEDIKRAEDQLEFFKGEKEKLKLKDEQLLVR
jgi:hypothetical protein